MSTSKITLIVLSMLLSGFAVGFFTAGRMASIRIHEHKDMMHNIALEKEFISKKIGLTTAQKKAIFPTLDSMLVLQKNIREEHHTAMKSVRKKMFDSMRPSLTSTQLKKLTHFTNKRRPPGPPPR
jgi:hypothetical protein